MLGAWAEAKRNGLRSLSGSLPGVLLLAPALGFLLILFYYPLGALMGLSVSGASSWTEPYVRLVDNLLYVRVLYRTVWLSAATTLICLLIGYPLARLLDSAGPKGKAFLLAVILLPFWSNFLVRTYGWMIILNPKGMINQVLLEIGLISEPLSLVYNWIGVLIGMVQIMLPYMVFPIASIMSRIDRQLPNAARSLGAGPARAFLYVYFPMTLPGVVAGALLVFTISLGFFVIPAILGGPRDLLLAQLIEFNVNVSLDWGFASALSTALLAVTFLMYAIAQRWFGLGTLWGSVR